MKTQISVIMSVFNQAKYLKQAIKSILEQTFTKFELLILDDASTDKSLQIIKSFKDPRIKIFRNKEKKGLSCNLNFLLKQAKGKYVARMDGDDISLPFRLQKQINLLKLHPQVVLVGGWAQIINKKGKKVGRLEHACDYQTIRKDILKQNLFVHPSIMFVKDIIKDLGGYNTDYFYSQDYELFLRLVLKHPCYNIPEHILKFRYNTDFRKQKKQHWLALKARWQALTKYGYPKKEWWKLIKPLFLFLLPIWLKKFYWQNKFKQ